MKAVLRQCRRFFISDRVWGELKCEVRLASVHLLSLIAFQEHRRCMNLLRTGKIPPRLHLGCGSKVKEEWINVDAFGRNVDLHLDIRRRLPFPDGLFRMVFAEHVFEHLHYEEAVNLACECYRILDQDGVLRVGIPDAGRYLVSYATKEDTFLRDLRPNALTPMMAINDVFRQSGQHKYAYDEETLCYMLKTAGFAQARKCDFQESLYPDLVEDSLDRRAGTLYVEAYK